MITDPKHIEDFYFVIRTGLAGKYIALVHDCGEQASLMSGPPMSSESVMSCKDCDVSRALHHAS